jgi:hypothetical protein
LILLFYFSDLAGIDRDPLIRQEVSGPVPSAASLRPFSRVTRLLLPLTLLRYIHFVDLEGEDIIRLNAFNLQRETHLQGFTHEGFCLRFQFIF